MPKTNDIAKFMALKPKKGRQRGSVLTHKLSYLALQSLMCASDEPFLGPQPINRSVPNKNCNVASTMKKATTFLQQLLCFLSTQCIREKILKLDTHDLTRKVRLNWRCIGVRYQQLITMNQRLKMKEVYAGKP